MTRSRWVSLRHWLWPVVYWIWHDIIEELVEDRCPVDPYPPGEVDEDFDNDWTGSDSDDDGTRR